MGTKGSLISSSGAGGIYGMLVTDNLYIPQSTGSFAYRTTDEASFYRQEAGTHVWSNAPSGSAGAAATLTERMRIDSSGIINMPYQPSARYGLPSPQAITTTQTTINFSSTDSTFGGYQRTGISSSGGVITVSNAGIYAINMCLRTETQPFATATQFLLYVDNSGTGSGSFALWQRLYMATAIQSSFDATPPFSATFQLVAGARFKMDAYHGGTNFTLSEIGNTVNFLTVNKTA